MAAGSRARAGSRERPGSGPGLPDRPAANPPNETANGAPRGPKSATVVLREALPLKRDRRDIGAQRVELCL
jgi:hypothetical protein